MPVINSRSKKQSLKLLLTTGVPWKLQYRKAFDTLEEAKKRELPLKQTALFYHPCLLLNNILRSNKPN
jgi:hypothetical protein